MTQIEQQLLRNQIEIMMTLNRAFPVKAQGRLDQAIVNSKRLLTTTIQREVRPHYGSSSDRRHSGLCYGQNAPIKTCAFGAPLRGCGA